MFRKHHLTALALLGFCISLLPSCAPPSPGGAGYAQVAAMAPGTARVWFVRTTAPGEQQGSPTIYANGNPIGQSEPGIAFYHDFPPGTYAFTVQSFGITGGQAPQKDTVQLAPGSQTYLEVLWGGSWLVGSAGGQTYFVRTLSPQLGQAYLAMLSDKGPPRAL